MDINKDKHTWVMTIKFKRRSQEESILNYCELMAKAIEIGIDKNDCEMRRVEES